MSNYKIVERKIGRAGNKNQMQKKKLELDRKYGEGNWKTGYEIDGKFFTREEVIEQVYDKSYFDFLDKNPKVVKELENSAGVYNPHALFSNSIDIQAATIERYFATRGLTFKGKGLLPIGSYQIKYGTDEYKQRILSMAREKGLKTEGTKIIYPKIAYTLSPFSIPCNVNPKMSIEDFWQSDSKVLAIKTK